MAAGSFRSTSDHTLDAKGRLNFPTRFRDVMNQYGSNILMIAPWGGDHLRAYPLAAWELFEDELRKKAKRNQRLNLLVRSVVGRVAECSLDKQGRIQLPANLRSVVGLEKNITLVGMIEHVEIWDKRVEEDNFAETNEIFDDLLAELDQTELS